MHRSGFVAIVGRPNVGKSTLMNHYLGQKIAIVSPKPQTTRRTQRGILTRPEAQLIFVDTPGLHHPRNALGQYMVNAVTRSVQDADVILFIADLSEPPSPADEQLAAVARQAGHPLFLALNKSDRLKPDLFLARVTAYTALLPDIPYLPISATRGDNLDQLLEQLLQLLPAGPALYPPDEISQTHLRDLAAEYIREAALNALEQEVPHGIAVEIETFEERATGPTYIAAWIYLERESHKPIVIGQGGQRLKQIGTAARGEIEKLLEHKVYLELRVKVRPDWRDDKRELHRLGYSEDK